MKKIEYVHRLIMELAELFNIIGRCLNKSDEVELSDIILYKFYLKSYDYPFEELTKIVDKIPHVRIMEILDELRDLGVKNRYGYIDGNDIEIERMPSNYIPSQLIINLNRKFCKDPQLTFGGLKDALSLHYDTVYDIVSEWKTPIKKLQ